jgi:DNA-binding LacI/PurR family transcriptional regulator
MSDIAFETGMSKETVKLALVTLRDKGYIASCPGKGYYVSKDADEIPQKMNVLMILSSLDIFKQLLVDSFTSTLMGKTEIKVMFHNSDVEQLESYIDQHQDTYDYYVVTPHFPMDEELQLRVARILGRIPNRKLILLDHCNRFMTGHFGAVCQDFEADVACGLENALEDLKKARRLNAVVLPTSRYSRYILKGVTSFCQTHGIERRVLDSIPENVEKGEVYLLLTGQLPNELVKLDAVLKKNNLRVGKDVGIISYNDVPLNAVVLGGLTTISTDFAKMGKLAAEMILGGKMQKVHNDFRMIRRNTF